MKKIRMKRIKAKLTISKILKITIGVSFVAAIIGGSSFGIYSLYSKDNRPNLLNYVTNDLDKVHNNDNYCGYSTESDDIYICYANNVQVRSSYKGLIGPKEVNKLADFLRKDVINGVEGISNSVIDFTPGLVLSNGAYTLGFRTDSEQRESKLDISPDFNDRYLGNISSNFLQARLKDLFYDNIDLSNDYDNKTKAFYKNKESVKILQEDNNLTFKTWDVYDYSFSTLNLKPNDVIESYGSENNNLFSVEPDSDYLSLVGKEDFAEFKEIPEITTKEDILSYFMYKTKGTSLFKKPGESSFGLINSKEKTNFNNFFHTNAYRYFDMLFANSREFITVSDIIKTLPISFKDIIDNSSLSPVEKIQYMSKVLNTYYSETDEEALNKDIPLFERLIYNINSRINQEQDMVETSKLFLDMYSSFFDNPLFATYLLYTYGLVERIPESANYGQSSPMTTFFSKDVVTLRKFVKRLFNTSNSFDIDKRIETSIEKGEFTNIEKLGNTLTSYKPNNQFIFSPESLSFDNKDFAKYERIKDDVRDNIINASLYTLSHEYGHHHTLSHFNAGSLPGRDMVTTFTVESGSANLYNKKLFEKLYKTINNSDGINDINRYNFLASNDRTTSTQVLPYYSFVTSSDTSKYNDMYGIYSKQKNPEISLPAISYNQSVLGSPESSPINVSVKDPSFDKYWLDIVSNLKPGSIIPNTSSFSSMSLGLLFTGTAKKDPTVSYFDDWILSFSDILNSLYNYEGNKNFDELHTYISNSYSYKKTIRRNEENGKISYSAINPNNIKEEDKTPKNVHLLEHIKNLDEVNKNTKLQDSFMKIYNNIEELKSPNISNMNEKMKAYLGSINEFVGLTILDSVVSYEKLNDFYNNHNSDKSIYFSYSFDYNVDRKEVLGEMDIETLDSLNRGISKDTYYGITLDLKKIENIKVDDSYLDQGSGLDPNSIKRLVAGQPAYRLETAEILTRALQVLTYRGFNYNLLDSNRISDTVLSDFSLLSSNGLDLYDAEGYITQAGKDLFDVYREMWGLKLDSSQKDQNGLRKVIGADDITRFYKVYRNRHSYVAGWIKKEEADKFNAIKFYNPETNKTVIKNIYTKNTSNFYLYNRILPSDSEEAKDTKWLEEAKINDVTGDYIQWKSEEFIDGDYANSDLESGKWEVSFVDKANIDNSNKDLETLSNFDYNDIKRLNYNYLQNHLSQDAYFILDEQKNKIIFEVR